jgi:hypothetical protein
MELAGSAVTWTGSLEGVFAERKHHKLRQQASNNQIALKELTRLRAENLITCPGFWSELSVAVLPH